VITRDIQHRLVWIIRALAITGRRILVRWNQGRPRAVVVSVPIVIPLSVIVGEVQKRQMDMGPLILLDGAVRRSVRMHERHILEQNEGGEQEAQAAT
jgi:hypothetical protein